MTLGKEEIQKIVLGAMMLVVLVYCYFSLLLFPLQRNHEVTRKRIEDYNKKIMAAKGQIARRDALRASAPTHALTLKQLSALIPEGSPVAWFPTRVSDYFKQYGVEKAVTRLTSEGKEAELTGFRDTTWAVDFQRVNFVPMAQALAGFENDQPLAEISSLQIESLKDDVESQHVLLNVNNLVKQ